MVAKGFLRLPDLHMLMKQKSLSLPRNLALGTFGELSIVFSTKVNLLYLLYPGLALVLSSASDKAKLLKTFILILMTQITLYLFSLVELI